MTASASPNGVGIPTASREHVRTMRMQRHLVVAGLTCLAGVVVSPTVYNLPEFVILATVVGVVLGSFARAVDARLGYGWGWLYGEPKSSTWLDRSIDGMLRAIVVRIRQASTDGSATDTVDEGPRVRILPVDAEWPKPTDPWSDRHR